MTPAGAYGNGGPDNGMRYCVRLNDWSGVCVMKLKCDNEDLGGHQTVRA